MGLLNWLFGSKPRVIEVQAMLAIDEFGSYEIELIGFRGEGVSSKNERFHLAWERGDEGGKGRAVFVADGKLIWQKEFDRPCSGSVAETGTVAILDWLFELHNFPETEGVQQSHFYVFNAAGDVIINSQNRMLLTDCGISEDGSQAWSLCGHNVMIHDLALKRGVADLHCDGFIPTSVEFKPDAYELKTKEAISFRFSRKGKLLNRESVDREIEAHHWRGDKPWGLLDIASRLLYETPSDKMNAEQFEKVISLLTEASERLQGYESRGAQVERQLGELKLERGAKADALKHFKKAVGLNPKVGVKKLMVQLEKELR